jgi:hypothetical protein
VQAHDAHVVALTIRLSAVYRVDALSTRFDSLLDVRPALAKLYAV